MRVSLALSARPSKGRPRAYVLLAAFACISCGARLMKLPTGPGAPVAPAVAAARLAQATSACLAVRTLTAEIAVSGSAGARRLRGRLLAGLSAPTASSTSAPAASSASAPAASSTSAFASVRLEAVAPFGPPLFIFVATGNDATLLLPRDNRVLEHGRPDEVLEATAGVPFAAADLLPILTGCTSVDAPAEVRGFGDRWNVVATTEGGLYLQREKTTEPWRIVANERRAADGARWRAESSEFQDGLPTSIRVTSLDEDGGVRQAFEIGRASCRERV